MKAILTNYRQSPRKVRLVADLIRGKQVAKAIEALNFLPKRAAGPISKLISSALANAVENFKVTPDVLFIKSIGVDKGVTLKRFRPRARGRASRINKRTSNLMVMLGIK